MMKCGESFNHYIQTLRKENHVLVTDGIYSWFRHPSYTGFYYWSIGTQLVLHNPVSGLLFAIAGWKFFSQRIPYEERSLIRLFGDQYYDYVRRSYIGIPFIPSFPKDEGGQSDSLLQQGEEQTKEAIEIENENENSGHDKKDWVKFETILKIDEMMHLQDTSSVQPGENWCRYTIIRLNSSFGM